MKERNIETPKSNLFFSIISWLFFVILILLGIGLIFSGGLEVAIGVVALVVAISIMPIKPIRNLWYGVIGNKSILIKPAVVIIVFALWLVAPTKDKGTPSATAEDSDSTILLQNDEGESEEKKEDTEKSPESNGNPEDTAQESSLIAGFKSVGYSDEEAERLAEIFINVGIPEIEDVFIQMDNDPLQANGCMYNGHQINFTTDNGECFYVQITGWKEEIGNYGWYRSSWSGKLKYGYSTETKMNNVDLYASTTDGGDPEYLAVYVTETDSVRPYDE